MKNKYEKLIEGLQIELHKKTEDYEKEAVKLDEIIKNNMKDYDAQIGVINPLRHELRVEIRNLYKFLNGLGDIGKNISVFDFSVENLAKSDGGDLLKVDLENYEKPEHKKYFFAGKLFSFLANRNNDKKAYLEMVECLEQQKTEFDEDLKHRDAVKNFYSSATKIADTYRCTLAMVKDAIDMTILPELSGIEAFLSAATIKDCIISKQDPRLAMPAKIDEFEGTLFDCHYVFVKNCVDYYTLIVDFFTKTVLTNIIEDNKITKKEKEDFEEGVTKINESTEAIKTLVRFGEV